MMIPINNNDDATLAKYELESALLQGVPRRLYSGDQLITTLTQKNSELTVEWGKLIFAWWDDDHSQNWSVCAYQIDQSEIRLQVTRGLGGEKSMLTIRDSQRWHEHRETRGLSLSEKREAYSRLLAKLMTEGFPGARLQRVTRGADRRHSVPGRFTRITLQWGREKVIAIGVSEAESQAEIDASITAGLIWLSIYNGSRGPAEQAKRCWFCLPRGLSTTAIERLNLIDLSHLGARLECFEVDECREEIVSVRPVTQNELLNTHPRQLSWPAASAVDCHWRGRILKLAPDLIESRHRPGHRGEVLAINGLEFVRIATGQQTRVKFGVAGFRSEDDLTNLVTLDESNFGRLERLVGEIARYRSSNSPDRGHPFYRLRPESWLESLLRRDVRQIDAALDARFVYSQIPAWREDESSVIDLLTINHEGRLVVIEIKVAEDPQLPLQGLDYWLRVEQARLRKEFERRGMFSDVEVADQAPLLYLVAPRLRFHRTFTAVARCLAPEIEAHQIGINTNWREGVRVHSQERINEMVENAKSAQ